MAHPRSTYNSLMVGIIATTCTSSPFSAATCTTTVTAASAGTSLSLSNKVASAIAQAFSHSQPTIIVVIRDNMAPVSSAPPAFSTSVCSTEFCYNGCCRLVGGFFRYVEVAGICVYIPVRVSHHRLQLSLPRVLIHFTGYGHSCFQRINQFG